MKYIFVLIFILLSSCGVVVEVQDTDDMYVQRSPKIERKIRISTYTPSTYYYPNPMIGYIDYRTWFMRPMGTIIIREAPKYDYGKRPTREGNHSQQNNSTHRRGRQ